MFRSVLNRVETVVKPNESDGTMRYLGQRPEPLNRFRTMAQYRIVPVGLIRFHHGFNTVQDAGRSTGYSTADSPGFTTVQLAPNETE